MGIWNLKIYFKEFSKVFDQFKAPFSHSNIKPQVNIKKNVIKDQNPIEPKKYKLKAQGKINAISRSSNMNKMITIKKWISKVPLESSKGSKPHS